MGGRATPSFPTTALCSLTTSATWLYRQPGLGPRLQPPPEAGRRVAVSGRRCADLPDSPEGPAGPGAPDGPEGPGAPVARGRRRRCIRAGGATSGPGHWCPSSGLDTFVAGVRVASHIPPLMRRGHDETAQKIETRISMSQRSAPARWLWHSQHAGMCHLGCPRLSGARVRALRPCRLICHDSFAVARRPRR